MEICSRDDELDYWQNCHRRIARSRGNDSVAMASSSLCSAAAAAVVEYWWIELISGNLINRGAFIELMSDSRINSPDTPFLFTQLVTSNILQICTVSRQFFCIQARTSKRQYL